MAGQQIYIKCLKKVRSNFKGIVISTGAMRSGEIHL